MSRRRELQARIASLGEISEILGAMKGLALVELRRVGEHIGAQRESVRQIETALAEVVHFHGAALPAPRTPSFDICCVIGAERGLCGDFNAHIAQAAATRFGERPPDGVILVGDKLVEGWGFPTPVLGRVRAPSVADEIPATLAQLLAAIENAADSRPQQALRLRVLHHGAAGIVHRQLLPPVELPPPRLAFAPRLYLDPGRCAEALIEHYLHTLLHAALSESLLEENRRRLEQMDQARHRLDERLSILRRRENRERQEEIVEEIEVILLTAS
ncbi:F0F1 ATP synthase subunit gamma [Fontimonas sp. SYSU GA230001]|uniref:F0F1 ATP synthase subunit gamma n=1 Tax=Fontimonas sp. SYSU GA230001 TaxID=3142450 RepID=UPI0032B3CA0A